MEFINNRSNSFPAGTDFPEFGSPFDNTVRPMTGLKDQQPDSYFSGSPFGASWDKLQFAPFQQTGKPGQQQQRRQQQGGQPERFNQITYHFEADTNALALIEHYENDKRIKEGYGSYEDDLTDICFYYEMDEKEDFLNPYCYVKMNGCVQAILDAPKNGPKWMEELIKTVVEDGENGKLNGKKPIVISPQRLKKAIEFALDDSDGRLGLLARFGSWLLRKLANLIRLMKPGEKRWNPDHKDYSPFLPINLIDRITKGWREFKEDIDSFVSEARDAGDWCEDHIPVVGDILKGFIDTIVSVLAAVADAVDSIMKVLEEFSHVLKLVNAFICGVLSELVETAAAIIDLIALFVRSIDTLERDKILKSISEAVAAFRKHPGIILEKIREGLEQLKSRYSQDKSACEIAFNLGEDIVTVILFIEGIVALVRALKNIPKMFSKLKGWAEKKIGKYKQRRLSMSAVKDEFITLSKRLAKKFKGKNLRQLKTDLDELYADAKAANKELKTATEDFARKTNGEAGVRPEEINNGLKSKERALEKIRGDYNNKPELLLDIVGSKVVYKTIDELYLALGKAEKEFEIVRFKDRILNPIPNGYRDILMNIKSKSGHIAEFRLHLKAMDEAAGMGHKLYTERRTLEALSKQRRLTEIEKTKIKTLTSQEKKIYSEAWEKIINN